MRTNKEAERQGRISAAAQTILSALTRKRDRNAVKSGEMEPYIMRTRKGGYKTTTEPRKSLCPHTTIEYVTDDKGNTQRVAVWENHPNCMHPATLGGQGISLPYQMFKGAGGRKTGVSSFQTHKVVVVRGTKRRKQQKARDGKRVKLLPEEMPMLAGER